MSTVQIPLVNDNMLFAIVDEEDAPKVILYEWSAYRNHHVMYAYAQIGVDLIGMHQLIIDIPSGSFGDHKDGDGLNNTRANLRIATSQQNTWNSRSYRGKSKFKGVSFRAWEQRWVAQIRQDGKVIQLGRFKSEEEAARAYDAKAIELRGEWARDTLNFPGL